MVTGISERIGQFVEDAAMMSINAGVAVYEQLAPLGSLLIGGRNFLFRAMNYVYSMDGFEKGSKVLIALLKLINEHEKCKGVFDKAMASAKEQKNLYYATLFIGSMVEFIDKNTLTFKIPTRSDGSYDLVKILYAIGNFLEAGKFCQDYNLFEFSYFTDLANRYGEKQWAPGVMMKSLLSKRYLINQKISLFLSPLLLMTGTPTKMVLLPRLLPLIYGIIHLIGEDYLRRRAAQAK